jgi:hypothetical protein
MRDGADQASAAVLSMMPVMVTVRQTLLAAKEVCQMPCLPPLQ